MDEDGDREADAEPDAVEGAVDAEKGGEAEKKFEFEEEEKDALGLGEDDGDGSEWTEALDPLRGLRRGLGGSDTGVELEDVLTDPLSLTRGARKPRQAESQRSRASASCEGWLVFSRFCADFEIWSR
jgi:hypothetical protein